MTFGPKHRLAGFMVLGLALILSGCGKDDYPTTPTPSAPAQEVGTIIIDQTPDDLDGAGWSLTGPKDQTGSGDVTLANMPTGEYTLTWDVVSDYITPTSPSQTLDANGTITFSGTYEEDTGVRGTIEIDQTPDDLAGAGWSLTGQQVETGSGDIILADIPPGEYTLTWDDVSGYITPPSRTQELAPCETDAFSGTYIELVLIPAGTFQMGSPTNELGRYDIEILHQVTLTHSIYVQSTEVTNRQYAEMLQWASYNGYVNGFRDNLDGSTEYLIEMSWGSCEISLSGDGYTVDAGKEDHPVLDVTWYGAVAYCDWLSLKEGLPRAYNHGTWECNGGDPYSATGYRLPTEAEWEYACRAGSQGAFCNGGITNLYCSPLDLRLDLVGWYCGNAEVWSHPVGQKRPNAWGLYDMHGNIWEWCNDWFGAYGGDVTDPTGPDEGTNRVFRGGTWYLYARFCRSACRVSSLPDKMINIDPPFSWERFGFRAVRSSD